MIVLFIILAIIVIVVLVLRNQQKDVPFKSIFAQPGPQDCAIDPNNKNDIELCFPDDLTTPKGVKNCCNHKKGGAEGACNYCEYSSRYPNQVGKCLTDNDYNSSRCQ